MRETSSAPLITWSRDFPALPEQVREARHFLASLADGHPAAGDAVLCLSELVTNACLHSRSRRPGGQFTVRIQTCRPRLRVEVSDQGGPWTTPAKDDHEQNGRGLQIVGQLTRAWGRTGNPSTGWTTWFEIGDPPAPRTLQPAPRAASQRWTTVIDGRQLQRLRRQHSLSQDELAAKAGISQSTVARLERHPRATCRSRTLARLDATLGQQPAALTPASQDTLTREDTAVPDPDLLDTQAKPGDILADAAARLQQQLCRTPGTGVTAESSAASPQAVDTRHGFPPGEGRPGPNVQRRGVPGPGGVLSTR